MWGFLFLYNSTAARIYKESPNIKESMYFNNHLNNNNMRSKGQKDYSTQELKRIKTAMRYNKTLPKPMSTNKLATLMAKELGRPYTGVYCKMLTFKTKTKTKTNYATTASRRVAVEGPKVSVQKQVSFGKPTKIEISDNGMTFYF